ncbi:MAG: DUF6785 family protein [Desulfococcaceae bacterium]|jgi:hypothetical protein|nr:DUF6785 family protein [Desulfococcaceae bacterium]
MNQPAENIRITALLPGLVLALLICILTPYNNTYLHATPLGGGHFPLAPFYIFIWLLVFTALLAKISGKLLFTGKELLGIWMLMVLVSGIAYTGLARTFFINLTAPWHFAGMGNNWENILHPLLPSAWYPQNAEVIESLYNGFPGGRRMGWMTVLQEIPWQVWIGPLLTWGGFILLCYGIMICIINLFSPQWIYKERLNLPLLRVPQLMEEALRGRGLGHFFTDRFLLAGIAIPVFLHLFNGLHFYYPQVPQIPTLILAGPYFPRYGIFSGFQKLKIYIYPAFIGFAFLTSHQISFSFWFFFVIGGLLFGLLSLFGYNIPAAALGITFGPTLSRPEECQMIGAYGIFFLFILWLSRYHLADIIQQSFFIKKAEPAENEWFSARYSFWGSCTGIALLIFWCVHSGMPLLPAMLMIGACFMIMLVATRVICQGGIAYFTLTAAPIDGLLAFFGPHFFSNAGLIMAAVIQKVLFLDLRESLMPSLLHAGSITQRQHNKKGILIFICITLIAAVAVSFVSMLALCYKYGARELQLDWATRTTVRVYENVSTLISISPQTGDWVLIFSAAGAAVMLLLVICYHRFYWWPLHPIGYLTTYSSAMRILWVSFFIGWLCNSLCMRYGGIVLFKKLRYFFIGLIIGDFLMGGTWALIGLFTDASYQVLPD